MCACIPVARVAWATHICQLFIHRRSSSRDAHNSWSPSTSPGAPKPLYLCSPSVEAALVKRNLKTIVRIPKYADIMERVSVNIFDFCRNFNEFYEVLAECCTMQSCLSMSAGSSVNYAWIKQDHKSVQLASPSYIAYVKIWKMVSSLRGLYTPTKSDCEFSQNFPRPSSTATTSYFVFTNLYHAHYSQIPHLLSEGHFKSLFSQFLAFGKEYELLDPKDIKTPVPFSASAPSGITGSYWKEMGILESS